MADFATVKKQKKGTADRPLTIVVGKGVSAKAVVRNLLKRRVRAIFQPVLREEGQRWDYVVIVRKEAASASFSDLKRGILAKTG